VGQGSFVLFIIYGLAFSLISSASTVIHKKDVIILVLAATIIWGIYFEVHLAISMIRCLGFATCVVFAIRWLPVPRVSSAFRAIAWKDVIIAILAVSIAWGIGVRRLEALGMVRFICFAALVTLGLRMAHGITAGLSQAPKVVLGALLPMLLCGAGGLIYRGVVGRLEFGGSTIGRPVTVGPLWGFALGLAVGLGISIGSEVIEWMARKTI
jgi:hypothetical protein